jgi:hypothetical protein
MQKGEAMTYEDAMLILMIAQLFVAVVALGR